MRVQVILESGRNRIILLAEGDAECRALGVLGNPVVAKVVQSFDGHELNRKVSSVVITLEEAPPAPANQGVDPT